VYSQRNDSEEWLLGGSLALILGLLFFSVGNFGVLNIYNIRRETQILLLGFLLLYFPFVIHRYKQWRFEPLWLMTFATLLSELLIRQNHSIFFIFDRMAALYVMALIFSFNLFTTDKILRTVIFLSTIFSTLVIIQAFVIWNFPTVLDSFVLGYISSTQGDKVDIGHPLEYLGFVSPGGMNVFGHPFARFRSFVSEPSAIICIFLAPGILALSYRDSFRWTALPILIFCILLSTSGTVYLSLFFGFLAFGALLSLGKWVKLLATLPFVIIIPWYWFVLNINIREFFIFLTALLEPLNTYYPVLTKTVSGTVRLSSMANILLKLFDNWDQYLFGAPFMGTGGMILSMLCYSGLFGLILLGLAGWKIFQLIILTYLNGSFQIKVMSSLLFGLFFQVLSFSDYGWMTMPGFAMLALIMQRLKFISTENMEGMHTK